MSETKPKKKLTTKQKKNRYIFGQWSATAGEVLSVITPFAILGAANYGEWFRSGEGWKVGLAGTLALALVGIAIFLVAYKKEKDTNITNGWIIIIVGWYMICFILWLIADIITQASMIMFWGGIGIVGAFGLDIVSKKCQNKATELAAAIKKAEQEKVEEQAKAEVNEEPQQAVE